MQLTSHMETINSRNIQRGSFNCQYCGIVMYGLMFKCINSVTHVNCCNWPYRLNLPSESLVCHFATHASRPLIHPDITNWFLIIFDFETEHKNVTVKWILIYNEWKPDSPYSLASHPPRPHRAATSGKIFIALFSLWTNSFSLNIFVISFPCSASFPSLFGVLLVLLCRLILLL